MLVYHVFRVAVPGHNTSYRTGRQWMESRDCETEAAALADEFNRRLSPQCIGVSYISDGPVDETVDVT